MRSYTRQQTNAIEKDTGLVLVGWYNLDGVLVPVFKRRKR